MSFNQTDNRQEHFPSELRHLCMFYYLCPHVVNLFSSKTVVTGIDVPVCLLCFSV